MPLKRTKQGGLHNLKLQSKEGFVEEYKSYDKTSAKNFYIDVLSDLERSVATGNITHFKFLSNIVDNINSIEDQTTLKQFHEDTSNPLERSNLLILACKHNQPEILKYLLSNDMILKNLSTHKESVILPDDEDETNHNAFYYAIRSNNIELLEALLSWAESFFDTYLNKFDEIFSKAYEELKLKNVPLTDEIEFFVEDKLLNLRFFSDSFTQSPNSERNLDNIKTRIDLVFENISLLTTSSDADVDDVVLFIIRFIAQNIHVLKRQLKFTYDRLPWEEIEFCLICFVSLHTKQQEINLFYHAALDKRKILKYLEIFARKLEEVKETIEEVITDKLANIPNLNRESVVAEIIKNNPQFEELYNSYHQIRDVYSLEKISNCINLASSVNPNDREGQLVITRVLQIIGEFLKNTLESPKLSSSTSDLLLIKLSNDTRKVITNLRDSLSHAFSLFKRIEIEDNSDIKFYIGVQNDLKKIGEIIIDILYDNKIKITQILLKKILDSENVYEITEVIEALKNVEIDNTAASDFRMLTQDIFENAKTFQNIKLDLDNFKTTEHQKLENLTKELKNLITDITDCEEMLFAKIDDIISSANRKFEMNRANYLERFTTLKCLSQTIKEFNKVDDYILRQIKCSAEHVLQNISFQKDSYNLKEIAALSMEIFRSVTSRKNDENIDEVKSIFYEIFYIAEIQTGDIKCIEEFRGMLNEKNSSVSKKKQSKVIRPTVEIRSQLELKLSELKRIIRNNLLGAEKFEKYCSYKNDEILQAVIEMILLDIMSILSMSNHYFENNLFYLDDNYPILVGKCLRNHLAHNNTLFDILLSNPSTAVILNANKFIEEDIIASKKKIGKMITDDPHSLREKFNLGLKAITYQRKMYDALEKGNLECLKAYLKKGADINARSINSWTALHYAAKGSSVKVIKFILEQNVQVNVEDETGQNPLHIAAAYGNSNIAKYLVEKAGLSVNKQDKNLKTPLHIAAEKGHTSTVEVLLKFNADKYVKDTGGSSALHYAIRNNHFHVVKILLNTTLNVDIDESMGGFTPLHQASETGNFEIVTLLLQKQANVNAKNVLNRTPLHAAAYNGHLNIAKTLILAGADVNARFIDGCTPLYNAIENGHEQVANILLIHGAQVNIRNKIDKYTPLHYAAKFGHVNMVKTLLKYGADAFAAAVDGETALHFAAEYGHLDIITVLLKRNIDINTKDNNSATPLHYAAQNGQKETVAFLIENGAKINVKDNEFHTPLYIAVVYGFRDILSMLIINKANVNEKNTIGNTVLHSAAINGWKDVADILIKYEAEINAKNTDDTTPLHFACLQGYDDVVILLIENKADVNAKGINGLTPLHTAIIAGHKLIVELLIKNGSDINAKTTTGQTSLCLAIENGRKEITQLLIVNGADVNEKSKDNFTTPLLIAVRYNHKEIVNILLDNGATVDDSSDGPLSLAVMSGYRDIVEILIKNKGRVSTVNAENLTLLHLAAKRGDLDIVKFLVKKGADVNAKTIDNVTPLHFAAKYDHEGVAQYLIAIGASVNARSHDGSTPLHSVAASGQIGVTKLLLNNHADATAQDNRNRTPLELAVANSHLEITKMLLQYKKVDINAKGADEWTLLHIAATGNNLKLVKYLINIGGDVNSRNLFGSKPIHIASRENFKSAVEYFLSRGCSIHELDGHNKTLMHYAAMENNPEIVIYLIRRGINVNAKDVYGSTSIHIAASLGYMDIIQVLLMKGAAYNVVDNFGKKPLDLATEKDVFDYLISIKNFFKAVKNNNFLDIKEYIKAGMFVDIKNRDGITPLYFAALNGYEEIINILLQHNANPNTVNSKAITPLHYAVKSGHLRAVKALLSYGAVFNAVSSKGNTPSVFSADKNITSLFMLITKFSKSVRDGNSRVIYDLNKISDMDTIRAIMNACNEKGETLIVAAIRCNFPNTEQLKHILQDGTPDALENALKLSEYGHYQDAMCIFKKVYARKKYILGQNNPSTLEIERHIATVLCEQGYYEEALDKLERIYQKQKETLGLDNKDTLKTRSVLALVLNKQNRNEEALEIQKEVLKMQKEIIGPNHPDTLETEFYMSLALVSLGKNEEALNINERIYEERKKKMGVYDYTTIKVQTNIAMILAKQGNYEQSLKIYRDVLDKTKSILGLYHVYTLRLFQTITLILLKQKKYFEALESFLSVLSIQKVILEPNHPDILLTQRNLRTLFSAGDKFVNPSQMYAKCYEKTKTALEPKEAKMLNMLQKKELLKLTLQVKGSEAFKLLTHFQGDMKTAIMNDDIQTVLYFLKEGIDVNEKDSDGLTFLHYAVMYERKDIVNILLDDGADIFQVTTMGYTMLHVAVLKDNIKIVRVLLQNMQHDKLKRFINTKSTFGNNTALHVAARNGYLNIVKTLLKHGAIYNIENKEGVKPQNISVDLGITNLLELLDELFEKAKCGSEEIIKKLQSVRGDDFLTVTNACNNEGNTLLLELIRKKHVKIAGKLSEMLRKEN